MTVTILKLKPTVVQEIRDSQSLKNRLQFELNISSSTLFRLLKTNSTDLTTASAMRILRDELKKTDSELLTEE